MLDDFDGVLRAARAGAGDAFATLYDDLARPVAAYLRSRGVPDVEDVTSEVFLAAFTGLAGFSGGQPQFRSWVFTIAHHRASDHWRRTSRTVPQVPYEPELDTRVEHSAEELALEALGTERVSSLLAVLTDEQREVLVLRVVADLPIEHVAQVTGRSPGSVKALQRRALATLRRTIETEAVPR